MKRLSIFVFLVLAASCSKETVTVVRDEAQPVDAGRLQVTGTLPFFGPLDVKLSGDETSGSDYTLSWEKGDVISGCWKDTGWHSLSFKVDSVGTQGQAFFSFLSGEIPGKSGTVISMVCIPGGEAVPFDGNNPLKLDFSDQSEKMGMLLFSKAEIQSNSLLFNFNSLGAVIRIDGLEGLPDLDFQGVKDYNPELRISGSHLAVSGSLGVDSEGNPVLTTSADNDRSVVLSRSVYGSGKASARQTAFLHGKEKNVTFFALPYTSDGTARTDLKIEATAVYGYYRDTLRQTVSPISGGEYVHVDDTLTLLPPSVAHYGDANAVVGWGRCRTATDTTYVLDGGRRGKKTVVLTATGDDGAGIRTAILNNDIIILDGSKGDFVFHTNSTIQKTTELTSHVENKTVVGVNNAFLRTKWHLTEEMVQMLKDRLDGKQYSQSTGTGDKLYSDKDESGFSARWAGKHGDYNPEINNENELMCRRAMVDITRNPMETYRDSSGVWRLNGAQNFIIRNLKIRAAGAVDVNGRDPITLSIRDAASVAGAYEAACNHVWIDHCDLLDGMDGNLDIGGACDFLSVSWTEQHYTPGMNYGHKYSCLIGGGEDEAYRGKGHITFDFCKWGEGIQSRTPMIRYGVAHLLNNYYSYRGTGTHMIDPQTESSVFLDHCRFEGNLWWISSSWEKATAVKLVENFNLQAQDYSRTKGDVSIPYRYPVYDAEGVNQMVDRWVGPNLTNPLDFQ